MHEQRQLVYLVKLEKSGNQKWQENDADNSHL